jgi:hypothetical protein
MEYDIIRNEEDIIVQINIDKKPVKPMYMRGIRKAQTTTYWREITKTSIGTNSLTGAEVELNPLEATIYLFCMQWYNRYENQRNPEVPVQTFDDMKYFLLEINSNAYYALLD